MYCAICTTLVFHPVCVCLFLSVLISHSDAERDRHSSSFGLFTMLRSGYHCNEVTVIQALKLFIRALLFLCFSCCSSTSSWSHEHRPFWLLTLCLSDPLYGGWYLSWTARRTLSTWTSCAVYEHHAHRLRREGKRNVNAEHQTSFVQMLRMFLRCIPASLNTKPFFCMYGLFTHISPFPPSQKQVC